mmetsp:Transcript_20866/g.52683  ORF Transcript_20866/g.52683 Transcript_20866/m.52683 type:complete len:211 (+) Transcript_20866:2529-3161(+)
MRNSKTAHFRMDKTAMTMIETTLVFQTVLAVFIAPLSWVLMSPRPAAAAAPAPSACCAPGCRGSPSAAGAPRYLLPVPFPLSWNFAAFFFAFSKLRFSHHFSSFCRCLFEAIEFDADVATCVSVVPSTPRYHSRSSCSDTSTQTRSSTLPAGVASNSKLSRLMKLSQGSAPLHEKHRSRCASAYFCVISEPYCPPHKLSMKVFTHCLQKT